jgi:hypothetical protein
MRGKPDLEDPCTLVAPDLSTKFDGYDRLTRKSSIVEEDEILPVWREWDAIRINAWTRSPGPNGWNPSNHYPERERLAADSGQNGEGRPS